MGSSLVKIDIHLIFHIKSTSPTMAVQDLNRIFEFMAGAIVRLNGTVFQIGGISNHVHILSSLPKNMCISDFVKSIKTASNRMIKSIDDRYSNFGWQNGYGAFSVSPNGLDNVVNYIKNQFEHHKKQSFQDEYKSILEACGMKYDDRFIFMD